MTNSVFSLSFCCVSRSGTMLEGYSPVTQALLGTLFTWGLTAAGAALVFVFSSRQVIQRKQAYTKKPQGFKARANASKKYLSSVSPVCLPLLFSQWRWASSLLAKISIRTRKTGIIPPKSKLCHLGMSNICLDFSNIQSSRLSHHHHDFTPFMK